jgi:hypothetical protein
MSRRGLEVFLAILGAVALGFGALAVVTGTSLIPNGGAATASIDSELRFYAVWYAAAGVVLIRAPAGSRTTEPRSGRSQRYSSSAAALGSSRSSWPGDPIPPSWC